MSCVHGEARRSDGEIGLGFLHRNMDVISDAQAVSRPQKRATPCSHAFPAQGILINEFLSKFCITIKKRMLGGIRTVPNGLVCPEMVTATLNDL